MTVVNSLINKFYDKTAKFKLRTKSCFCRCSVRRTLRFFYFGYLVARLRKSKSQSKLIHASDFINNNNSNLVIELCFKKVSATLYVKQGIGKPERKSPSRDIRSFVAYVCFSLLLFLFICLFTFLFFSLLD
jgi:hypothetical protein